jgi:galactose mutarotase-like enzyme
MPHALTDTEHEGVPTVTLSSPDGVAVSLAPGLGMVGCSLRHRGDELLGQLGGLAAYRDRQSTFGIPLLHPWANRLSGFTYTAAGRTVELDPASAVVHRDGNGLPMHGVDASARDWAVVERTATADAARLVARLDYGADPARLAAFSFPHVLELTVTLRGAALSIETAIEAAQDGPVPMSFGWHPYLVLPGVARADWAVTIPACDHLELDARSIPTGARAPVEAEVDAPLGARTFDDGYADVPVGATFVVAGGGRRVAVSFDGGYPCAQVYAPDTADVVCFEPMTAPADALVTGDGLTVVEPGARRAATFTIAVDAA